MYLLININLYVFKKSNDLDLYFVIQTKSKIDPNNYFFFPMASTCCPDYYIKKQCASIMNILVSHQPVFKLLPLDSVYSQLQIQTTLPLDSAMLFPLDSARLLHIPPKSLGHKQI